MPSTYKWVEIVVEGIFKYPWLQILVTGGWPWIATDELFWTFYLRSLSRFDHIFRINRWETIRIFWCIWRDCLGRFPLLWPWSVPWCKRGREPVGGSVSPTLRKALLAQEKLTQVANKENVSLRCEGWKFITHVLFPTQLQRAGETPTTRVLGFGAGWSCWLMCPLGMLVSLLSVPQDWLCKALPGTTQQTIESESYQSEACTLQKNSVF